MKSFLFLLIRAIVFFVFITTITTSSWLYLQSMSITEALTQSRIMIGDSHVLDLNWENAPRISSPANSLLTQYLSLKRFGELPRDCRPSKSVFVFSIHPGVFTLPQEKRLADRDPAWSVKKAGEISSLFRLSDLKDPLINTKLKLRLLFARTQYFRIPLAWQGTCNPSMSRDTSIQTVELLTERFSDQSFMSHIPNSLKLFNEINRMACDFDCEIIWLDNPSHPKQRACYSEKSKNKYDIILSTATKIDNVHYLDLSTLSEDPTHFRDGDHIFCEIAIMVEQELNRTISKISSEL